MSRFDGSWGVTLHAPQGAIGMTLDLASAGPSGTMSSEGVTTDLMDVAIDGAAATWRARITQPMPMVVEFSATVDGDEMTGTATAASVIKIPFDGKRS